MIRHIVLFSAKNETDIARVIDGLALLAKIPHAGPFEIVRNAKVDQIDNKFDVVHGEFDNETALAT